MLPSRYTVISVKKLSNNIGLNCRNTKIAHTQFHDCMYVYYLLLSFRLLFIKEIVHFNAEFSFLQFMFKLSRLKPDTRYVMSGELMFLLCVIKVWLLLSLQVDKSSSKCRKQCGSMGKKMLVEVLNTSTRSEKHPGEY